MALQSKSTRVSDFGKKGSIMKSGYASGGPDDIVIGNKPGKTNKVAYNGPCVARPQK